MYFSTCEPWLLLAGLISSSLCCSWWCWKWTEFWHTRDRNCFLFMLNSSKSNTSVTFISNFSFVFFIFFCCLEFSAIFRHDAVAHLGNAAWQTRNCALDRCGIEWRSGCSSYAGRVPSSRPTHWRGWRSPGRSCPPLSPAPPPAHSHLAPIAGEKWCLITTVEGIWFICAEFCCFGTFLANFSNILNKIMVVVPLYRWQKPCWNVVILCKALV